MGRRKRREEPLTGSGGQQGPAGRTARVTHRSSPVSVAQKALSIEEAAVTRQQLGAAGFGLAWKCRAASTLELSVAASEQGRQRASRCAQ